MWDLRHRLRRAGGSTRSVTRQGGRRAVFAVLVTGEGDDMQYAGNGGAGRANATGGDGKAC